jgi:hypothetical protein
MGQFSDITVCDLFLMLFFLSRTNPVAKMGIVSDSLQKEHLSATLTTLKCDSAECKRYMWAKGES